MPPEAQKKFYNTLKAIFLYSASNNGLDTIRIRTQAKVGRGCNAQAQPLCSTDGQREVPWRGAPAGGARCVPVREEDRLKARLHVCISIPGLTVGTQARHTTFASRRFCIPKIGVPTRWPPLGPINGHAQQCSNHGLSAWYIGHLQSDLVDKVPGQASQVFIWSPDNIYHCHQNCNNDN